MQDRIGVHTTRVTLDLPIGKKLVLDVGYIWLPEGTITNIPGCPQYVIVVVPVEEQ